MNLQKKGWNLNFFFTFNIILSQIFPEHLIKISQVVQRIWRFFVSLLAIFINFHQFFWLFWHFLFTNNLMTSAYNRWYHHYFTSNMRQIDFLTIVWNYHDVRIFLLKIWEKLPEKLPSKNLALLGLVPFIFLFYFPSCYLNIGWYHFKMITNLIKRFWRQYIH